MTDFKLRAKKFVPEPINYGSVSPSMPAPVMKEKPANMSYLNALSVGSLPYRFAETTTQRFLSGDEPEEGYKPFDVWKENGAHPQYFDEFMDTKNSDQAIDIILRINQEKERRKAIEQYGLVGEAGDFVFNVATSPDTYLAFGAGMMLKSGMKAWQAFGLSGAAAGATNVALENIASPEQMTTQRALTTIVATTAFSGILGGALDSYASLKAKNIVKDELPDLAVKTFDEAAAAPQRINNMDIGAMAVKNGYEQSGYDSSLGGNIVARALGKGIAFAVPKLYGQTAELKNVRDAMLSVFGQAGYSKMNLKGVGTPTEGIGAKIETIREQAMLEVQNYYDKKKIVSMFGKEIDRADYIMATKAIYDDSLVSQLTPLQKYDYDFKKTRYGNFANEFERLGVDGFTRRSAYHGPARFDKNYVAENYQELLTRVQDDFFEKRATATSKADELQVEVENLRRVMKESPDPRVVDEIKTKLTRVEDHLEYLKSIARASDEELMDDASLAAQAMGLGHFTDSRLATKDDLVQSSKYFKPRYMDVEKYVDFLEVESPALYLHYANNVSPFLAFKEVLGKYKNFDDFLEDFTKKSRDEIVKIPNANVEKLNKELDRTTQLLKRFWNTQTGIEQAQKYSDLGALAPFVSSAHSLSYITQMVGQTLAAIQEPIAIAMHHGLKGTYDMGRTMSMFAASKEIRAMSKEMQEYTATATSLASTHMSMQRMGYEMVSDEMSNKMVTTLKKGELLMRKGNLSAFHDDWVRNASNIVQKASFKESLKNFSKLKEDQKAALALWGVDANKAAKISNQIEKYGKDIEVPTIMGKGKIFVANEKMWTDREALDAWVSLIRQDSKSMFIQTQTGDVPFLFRTPVGGLFTKYKSWGMGATTKYLLQGIQNPKFMSPGMASLVLAAGITQNLYDSARGQEISTDPDELLWGAINRAGVLGVFPETGGSYLLNKLAGTQSGGARFYQYQDLPGTIAGPVGSLGENLLDVVTAPVPVWDSEAGEYKMTGFSRDGGLKRGVVSSAIDLIPVPGRPLLKPHAMELIE